MPDPEKAPKFEETEEVKSPNAPSFDDTEPIDGLKKKEPTNAPSNLASAGGSSASATGALGLPKTPIDFEGARTYKVPTKTALGNKVISYTKPSATIGLDEEASNKKIAYDSETKKLVDHFDNYKSTLTPDKPLTTAGFYLENLKKTNPDEYNYVIDKQKTLSEEGDPLKLQEYHADLVKKSLSLKTRVMGGKIDLISNNIKDNYKPILDDFDTTSKQSEDLANKITGIDEFMKSNFQVDENGQVITNATNRKKAEDMLNKRKEFITQLQGNKTKLDELSTNQDFIDAMSQLDDVQHTYDSAAAMFKDFADKNPEAYKNLPDLKKQIEKEQSAQFSKDINEPLDGDLGIMEGAGRGGTSIVKSLAYGLKNLGSDKEYGWTDKLYDDVKGSLDKFDKESNPLPTGYDKPVYEDGQWNMKYLPGKLSQTVVEMAPMALATSGIGATAGLLARGAAAQELGYTLGAFTGEHFTVVSNYYDQAKEAGMSEDDAQDFANKTATVQAMIAMLSPDLKLLKGNKIGLDEYTRMVAQGVSKKDAAKQAAKTVVNNMLKEIPQENLQTWKEIQDQNSMYESMGLNGKIKQSVTNDIVETTIVSAIISAGFGLGGAKSTSTLQKEAAFMAASQPDLILQKGQKLLEKGVISPEQFEDLSLKVVKATEALNKVDKNVSAETKSEVLPAMMEKDQLREEKQSVDDSQHDIINEKIKNKDEEIRNIMEAPSKEQVEHDDFLKGFDAALTVDEKKPVEIPKSENEMQLEGLIELDDSEKSLPVELSVIPETQKTEKESNEDKIALLEQARKDLKEKEFWQEKIDYKEFSKRDNALEKEINALKKPVAIEEEKIAENVEQDKGEPVAEKKQDKKTESTTETPAATETEKGPSTESTEKKTPNNDSLIDEEEEAEDKVKDDQDVLKKMQDDLNVLKQFSVTNDKQSSKTPDEIRTLATKKYQGMIERAYKAKLDGKINRSTYTIFRNAAGDILGPKIAEKNREVKGQIDAIRDKIKEKLLGEGYKSGQVSALSSLSPITPKTVENFIDLTADLVKRGVDAGHEVRKVIEKALDYVKSHKNYESALQEAGIDNKKFRKLFESKISEVESIVEEKPTEENPVEKKAVKSSKDVKAGDILTDVNGKKGTVTAIDGDKITMDMENGGTFSANPKVVELFAENATSKNPVEKPAKKEKSAAKKEMDELLTKGVQNSTIRRDELIAEGKTKDEAEEITYKEFLETKDGKRYQELENSEKSNTEKPIEKPAEKRTTGLREEDIQTGERSTRKGTERLANNERYSEILKSMSEEDKNYNVMSLSKLYESVKNKIVEFEKAGLLDSLANDLLNKEKAKDIPQVIMPELLTQLGDKFNMMAEQEQNEFVRQQLYDKAAALFADKGKIMTTSAQVMNAGRLSAERMPTSEAGIKSFVKEKMDQVQNESMSETNKQNIELATKELVDLQVRKELEKIASGTMSTERIEKIKGIRSLKIDLSDC